MTLSMTGFGRQEFIYKNKNITIDVRSLNSKQVDISTRIPSYYKTKEIEIRKVLSEKLKRGKIEISFQVEINSSESSNVFNQDVISNYYKQVKEIANNLNISNTEGVLPTLLKMQDALNSKSEKLDEEEWIVILENINIAVDKCIDYRKTEGEILKEEILSYNTTINNLLEDIEKFEDERIETVKNRLQNNIKENELEKNLDQNRFEQELIFYIEKLDITEEKVRLKQHCEYFANTFSTDDSKGKKLGFISQEMGREINTLGSKSNHAEMQKVVVKMKTELEKIKEQLLNIL